MRLQFLSGPWQLSPCRLSFGHAQVELVGSPQGRMGAGPSIERGTKVLPLVAQDHRGRPSNASVVKNRERRRQPRESSHGKENSSSRRKNDQRTPTTPTKHRDKNRADRIDGQSAWQEAAVGRYKDPRMWRLQHKKVHGWGNETVARRHSAAASASPQSLLLVGDRALAVKVGKVVSFSDAANETLTFRATGNLRRRRSDSHTDRRR